MPNTTVPEFSWDKGSVTLHEGLLYVSPNCKRAVKIPKPGRYDPFRVKTDLMFEDFKQPVWWSPDDAWLSFIPLAPSFVARPFHALCWIPKFDKSSGLGNSPPRYYMRVDDGMAWRRIEDQVKETAMRLRLMFNIESELPPTPSENIKYEQGFRTLREAQDSAAAARDWYGVWMGLLSFCIAWSKLVTRIRDTNPAAGPVWYQKLHDWDDKRWPQSWLDGLNHSTVCQFNADVPRAGIVADWTALEKLRPDINWFLEHHVPVFYPWTAHTERKIVESPILRNLKPPIHLLQTALTLMFRTPSLPMWAFLIRNFRGTENEYLTKNAMEFFSYNDTTQAIKDFLYNTLKEEEWPAMLAALQKPREELALEVSAVLEEQRRMITARAAEDAPATQGMLEDEDEWRKRGTLVEDCETWFRDRALRTRELIKGETDKKRQQRLQKAAAKGTKKCDVYEWVKIDTSGGKVLYMRTRVHKARNNDVLALYSSKCKVYNAVFDEWDVCEHLQVNPEAEESEESDNWEDYYPPKPKTDWGPLMDDTINEDIDMTDSRASHDSRPISPTKAAPVLAHGGTEQVGESSRSADLPQEDDSGLREGGSFEWEGRNLREFFELGLGWVPLVPQAASPENVVDPKRWLGMLRSLGFLPQNGTLEPHLRKQAEEFYSIMSSPLPQGRTVIRSSSLDLDPESHRPAVKRLAYKEVHRPSRNLYVFSLPRAESVEWFVGVESPDLALFCMRYLAADPDNRTVFDLARELACRGMRFRTLQGLRMTDRMPIIQTFKQAYEPKTFREKGYKFTPSDFESWITQAEDLLSLPRTRAALMRGGIAARIAREALGLDRVLEGPSWEVLECRIGFIAHSGTDRYVYADDELSEDDLARLSGAYALYDGKISHVLDGLK